MNNSRRVFRKIIASALSIAVVGGVGLATPVGSLIGTNVTVSAATHSPVVEVGDFQYILYSDKTAKIVGYTGAKDHSTDAFGLPSVIYAKDIETTWSYNDYIDQYQITGMQANIFSGCSFKLLGLPRFLQSFTGAFNGNIGAFSIDSNNSYFSTSNSINALYSKDGNSLYAYPTKQTLYSSSYGTSVVLSNTVKRIESGAFDSCTCTEVEFPASVTFLGDRVFNNSSIGKVTFKGDAPTFYALPGSYNDHGTFEGAKSLYNITISGGGNYSTDGYGVLYNGDKTKLILCPQGKTSPFNVNENCTEIGDYAFYGCKNAKVVFYDQVTKINSNSFYNTGSNFKLYVLKDTYAYNYAVSNGMSYTLAYEYSVNSDNASVTITKYNGPYTSPGVIRKINGKDVTAIGSEAFKGNKDVTYVYLYSPITTIADNAFNGCSNLKKVTIPSTVTSIGDRAFYLCSSLNSVTIPSKLKSLSTYVFGHCTSLTSVVIPDTVTTVASAAFYGCTSLESLKIGSGVTSIGAFAFENTALETQFIPNNVTTIGGYAFGFNYSNGDHTRNNNFKSISGYSFSQAQTYANNNYIPFNSVMTFEEKSDGTYSLSKYSGSETKVVIPGKVNGKNVTGINKYAFEYTDVETVTLPDTFTSVSPYAFYEASKLKKVNYPSTITSIGAYAFEFCDGLTSMQLPSSVTSIRGGAFYGCRSLATVTLNSGLKTIGEASFANTALTSVSIPSTVTSIDSHAFAYTYKNSGYVADDSFDMTGYAYSAADTYATNNPHITFHPLYYTLVNTSSISSTSVYEGQKVTIYTSSTGGKKPVSFIITYKIGNNSTEHYILQKAVTSQAEFTPEESGSYTITVTAVDDRGITAEKKLYLRVNEKPEVINESTISATSIYLGDDINVTAAAAGGVAPVEFAVYYKQTTQSTWTCAQSYSTNTEVTIKPKAAKTYNVRVKAKDSLGTITNKDFKVTVQAVSPLSNTSKISATAINLGSSVKVTASATGGKAPYQYAVYYKQKAQSTWTCAQSYSTTTSVTVTPKAATTYNIRVKVKDNSGEVDNKDFTVTVTKVTPLSNTSKISATTIALGSSVKVTASATGGTKPYQYAVFYKQDTQSTWTCAQSYKTNTSVTITPKAAKSYTIRVKVKDANDEVVNKDLKLTVTENTELKNTSKIDETSINKGQSVDLTLSATGGTKPYQFAVYYKQKSQENWTKVQDYGTSTSSSVTPKAATQYVIRVKAKDANGTVVNKDFSVTVNN